MLTESYSLSSCGAHARPKFRAAEDPLASLHLFEVFPARLAGLTETACLSSTVRREHTCGSDRINNYEYRRLFSDPATIRLG
jgi:hypothetical protein